MNYDNIFGEGIYEEDDRSIEKDYEDLAGIFYKNGFDKQLRELDKANMEMWRATSAVTGPKNYVSTDDKMQWLIESMAMVHTLIESFIVANEDIFNIVDAVKKKYIEHELSKEDNIKSCNNNRIAYLLNNKTI